MASLVFYYRPNSSQPGPTNSPEIPSSPSLTPSLTPTPESTILPRVSVKPTEEPFLGLNNIKSPATCQVDGVIDFTDATTFLSTNSRIAWQNIDSSGRLINWKIFPVDKIAVGPNIFANLTVPDGQYHELTIRLPEKPIAKKYTLTASVTYGQIIQGDVKIKESDCTGRVEVNLNF